MKNLINTTAILALCAGSALAGSTTVVDFEDGMSQGWEGPQGFGGASFVDATNGVDGGAGYRT